MGPMKKTYRFLKESLPSKTVVFTFGRFQPPSAGHEHLIRVLESAATGADAIVFVSSSKDTKRNPLSAERKIHYLRLMFPRVKFVAAANDYRTFMEVAVHLNKQYNNLIMVAGSDRVLEYQRLLNQYNGKDFNYKSIKVISAGSRDPDAEGVEGISGTKMRAAALKGDFVTFKKGASDKLRSLDVRRMMNDIRVGSGMEEIKENVELEISSIRDQYIKGNIFNVGDKVVCDSQTMTVIKRGSNHIVVEDSNNDTHNKWLTDCKPEEEMNKDTQLDEAVKIGTRVQIHAPGKDYHKKIGNVGEIRHGAFKGAAKTYTVDYDGKSVQLDKNKIKVHKNTVQEDLSNTIKTTDKIKVARVIADMMGVKNADTLQPEQAVNAALRNLRRMVLTPGLLGVARKMLNLANEVGIKYDSDLLPRDLKEAVAIRPVKTVKKDEEDPEELKDLNPNKAAEAGHTLIGDEGDDQLRRRKVLQMTQEAADDKAGEELDNLSDDDLDKMADTVDHEDDLIDGDLYDPEELDIVDADTGEVIEADVDTAPLNEVLSRMERIKAAVRFARSKSKRARRIKIVLKTRSSTEVLNRRARKLAVQLLKTRLVRKPLAQMTVAEKERVEKIISKRKSAVNRLAMKLVSRVRKIENNRLSNKA